MRAGAGVMDEVEWANNERYGSGVVAGGAVIICKKKENSPKTP